MNFGSQLKYLLPGYWNYGSFILLMEFSSVSTGIKLIGKKILALSSARERKKSSSGGMVTAPSFLLMIYLSTNQLGLLLRRS